MSFQTSNEYYDLDPDYMIDAYDCTEGASEGSQWCSTQHSEVRNHWKRADRNWNPERVAEAQDAELMVHSLSLFQSSLFALARDPGVPHSLPLMLHPWLPSTAPSVLTKSEKLI
ncbi:MAG TPA: hypothetical protein VLB68_14045 [Pyrinomonadaceae bacterium]|nr:hypothetical protein [Pyrinomonadaceae bacterium]